ncbi:MAG: glycosyl hydrolase family 18 [Lachnospiraceae bacterium]
MEKKKIIIPAAVVVLLIIVISIISVVRKNMPSKKHMDLKDYFNVQDGQVQLILQDEPGSTPGLYEDGQVYLDMGTVKEILNPRFYWDSIENKLLYTTSSAIITAEINSNISLVNKRRETKDYKIVKVKDDIVYVAADYIKQYTAVDYKKFDNPDRVVINYKYGVKEKYSSVKKETQLRYEADTKSDILSDLEKGAKLLILEDGDNNGFYKAMTEDGIIGYVKEDRMGSIEEEMRTTNFQKEEYTHTLLPERVNLVWHQVTNSSANSTLSDLIVSTKGVNVVAPTWFKTIDNAGNISSIADDTYIERAHASGLQVWGLCDDFDPGMKIGKVLRSTTRRQRLAKNLIAEAIRYNLDGINIDFENVRQENGEDFIQFIRELGIMCRNNGVILSIDNYPPASYSEYYNRTEQANVADYIITMAYDEYYAGSEEAGPVSSLGYVKDSVKNTIEQVPAEQTIIALPFYSRIWTETTENGSVKLSSEACSMGYASELASGSGAEITWDEEAGLDYVEYRKNGSICKMWIENPKSLDLKMKAVIDGGAAGMAFWKLGMETAAVWDTVAKYCG